MPTNIRIIHANDFIKATPEGELDLQESKRLLIEIAVATDPSVDHEVILDTRKAQSGMSIADLWYLAADISNLRKAFSRKTAVLCPLAQFDHAGFFALCARNKGLQVRAFTSFEDTIEWLTGDGPDA
jgi:hypothetical protein